MSEISLREQKILKIQNFMMNNRSFNIKGNYGEKKLRLFKSFWEKRMYKIC